MEIFDFVISFLLIALVLRLVWEKFNSHPSDKYHNDSWKNARKRKK